MGQKCNPLGFRLGENVEYRSCWFASKKNFAKECVQDYLIRRHIRKNFSDACIESIFIDKILEKIVIHIFCLKPNLIIGKDGETISSLCDFLTKKTMRSVFIYVSEIEDRKKNAAAISHLIAGKIKERLSPKKVARTVVHDVMQAGGVNGVRICFSGRLGGAEIARSETTTEGSVPLNSVRNDIDFKYSTIETEYGTIGLKVFINKGMVITKKKPTFRVFNKNKNGRENNKKMTKK